MSYIKYQLFRMQEGRDHPETALDDIARALGGEVSGRAILVSAPSMTVYVDPTNPRNFFIYDTAEPLAKAMAWVREKLNVVDPVPAVPDEVRTANALEIWNQGRPAAGTNVETYLRSRAITLPVPDVIRFHPGLYHRESRIKWPAMLALVTDADDVPRAIHRTWLAPSGSKKAPVEMPRMALGPIKGCAIRLAPAAEHIAVGEGIETCMSVMMTGRPTWSALTAVGIRTLVLPECVRTVSLLVDCDDHGEGEGACGSAALRWRREGRQTELCRPPAGMDFNDLLRKGT